jgi:hypothetical protein
VELESQPSQAARRLNFSIGSEGSQRDTNTFVVKCLRNPSLTDYLLISQREARSNSQAPWKFRETEHLLTSNVWSECQSEPASSLRASVVQREDPARTGP